LAAVALSASVLLGGAVTLLNASRSVRTEIRSALLVGQQTVDNRRQLQDGRQPLHLIEGYARDAADGRSDPPRDIERAQQ
jgi:hypothetical protein